MNIRHTFVGIGILVSTLISLVNTVVASLTSLVCLLVASKVGDERHAIIGCILFGGLLVFQFLDVYFERSGLIFKSALLNILLLLPHLMWIIIAYALLTVGERAEFFWTRHIIGSVILASNVPATLLHTILIFPKWRDRVSAWVKEFWDIHTTRTTSMVNTA